MSFKYHFELMAGYNLRMNDQLYQAASNLTEEKINENLGSFFGSVLGTLNHIMVGDLLWLSRFEGHSEKYVSLNVLQKYPKPVSLSEKIYPNLQTLHKARKEVDKIILKWIKEDTEEAHFSRSLSYKNSKNILSRKIFAELLSHLFNHQTHHRGQVSTLLSQLGYDVGVTDFLIDIPEK